MKNITPMQVKELREKTSAGFMDCKKALEKTNGDVDKAVIYLRESGLATAAKKAGRATSEGLVYSYIHGDGRLGVLIEVNCETDFVARTEEFKAFVHNIAMHIAAVKPKFVSRDEIPQDVVDSERDILYKKALGEGKPEAVVKNMVEGRLGKYFKEICLLDQPYVKDPNKSVSDFLKEQVACLKENITIRRFTFFSVGGD